MELYSGGSFPVGLVEQATFSSTRVQFEPGDTLVLYSDGITEAENAEGALFGFERLGMALEANAGASIDQVEQNVLTAIENFAAGASQSDDITMLIVRYLGQAGV